MASIETPQDRRAYIEITGNTIPRMTDETISNIAGGESLAEANTKGVLCPNCKLYPNKCHEQSAQTAKRAQLEPNPQYRHLE